MTVIDVPGGSLFGLGGLTYGVLSARAERPRAGARVAGSVVEPATGLKDDVFTRPSRHPFMARCSGAGPIRPGGGETTVTPRE